MWRGRPSIPHVFESHQVSDVSHRRGGCQKTSAHRVVRRSGRCRSSLASGSMFTCGGMYGPWWGGPDCHTCHLRCCVCMCPMCAQFDARTSGLRMNPEPFGSRSLPRRPECACGERVRDTAIVHVFVGVNIRVLDWCPPQSVTWPKGTTHVCPD